MTNLWLLRLSTQSPILPTFLSLPVSTIPLVDSENPCDDDDTDTAT